MKKIKKFLEFTINENGNFHDDTKELNKVYYQRPLIELCDLILDKILNSPDYLSWGNPNKILNAEQIDSIYSDDNFVNSRVVELLKSEVVDINNIFDNLSKLPDNKLLIGNYSIYVFDGVENFIFIICDPSKFVKEVGKLKDEEFDNLMIKKSR